MKNKTLKYTLPLLLITLLCVVGVESFYFFMGTRYASRDLMSLQPSGEQQGGEDSVIKDSKKELDLQVITERNLFSSRETTITAPLDVDPLEGIEPSSLAVVLMGTVLGSDGRQRAIIYDKKLREQDLYREGDFVHQAIVKKILRGKVILNLNGKDEMLDISEARNVHIARSSTPLPSTTVQRVVSRPAGGDAEATQLPSAGVEALPGTAPADGPTSNPKQLRSFRGGITVKGRTAGDQ